MEDDIWLKASLMEDNLWLNINLYEEHPLIKKDIFEYNIWWKMTNDERKLFVVGKVQIFYIVFIRMTREHFYNLYLFFIVEFFLLFWAKKSQDCDILYDVLNCCVFVAV